MDAQSPTKLIATCILAFGGGALIGYVARQPAPPVEAKQAEPERPPTLGLKAASIDAGRLLRADDASIDAMERLLGAAAAVYRTQPQRAADMAATASDQSKSKSHPFGIAQALEAALMLCRESCNEDDLASHLALYAVTREGGQSHHQTLRGLIILESRLKALQGSQR